MNISLSGKLIGLLDLDSKIPNLALMKISAWYKIKNNKVKFWNAFEEFDKVFVSKVFTESKLQYKIKNCEIGGSGFSLTKKLPEEIEHIYPDYSLYKIKYAMGYLCYDKETELLTYDGWKYFKDLSFKDKVLTLNPSTFKIEYQKPNEIICNDYTKDLIHFKNKYVDLLVTPNHRMFVKKRDKSNKFKFLRADFLEDLYQFQFKKDGIWIKKDIEYYYLPEIDTHNNMNVINRISMDLWLEFLGYYISEGNIQYKKTNNYIIKISQLKKSKYYSKIEKCIKKLGLNCYKPLHGDFYLSNKHLYNILKPLGKSYEKYIPKKFLQLSKRQLKILWDAIYLGDGTHFTKNNKNNTKTEGIITSSHKLASNLQELLLKMGYCGDIRLIKKKGTKVYFKKEKRFITANHDQFIIYKNTRYTNPNYSKQFTQTKRKFYNNKIYCCSVPNEILYVRRNGIAVWCGNTRGCINNCKFCIVREKEGVLHKVSSLNEFWNNQKELKLLDNAITDCKDARSELIKIRDLGIKLDLTQGFNVRTISQKTANILGEIKNWGKLRWKIAWDNIDDEKKVMKGIERLNKAGIKNKKIMCYVLVNFNSSFKQDLYRVEILKKMKIFPYVMIYEKQNAPKKILHFRRWSNNMHLLYGCTFIEYMKGLKGEYKKSLKNKNKPISKTIQKEQTTLSPFFSPL